MKERHSCFHYKSRDKDYIAAKSFMVIILMSFLFKAIGRIVDRWLFEGSLDKFLFDPSQYPYGQGRSTETALHAIVLRVEKAL